ncbi:MAG: 16S rRNA (guanine(527)-N(7))-methyltransferase RsmG [Methylococcales bacterium]|nr:16S rRNA (guanine(527)-N(7))-methyltransferase RsmG [Methylococcales bacterium]
MDNCTVILREGLSQLNLEATPKTLETLLNFIKLILKWNKAYNLTAIREPEAMVKRHLLDSLSIYPYLQGQRMLDVGTGAGLPSIPLSLFYPEKQFVLLDSNAKKTRFVQQAIMELNLNNVSVYHERVENFKPEMGFDTVMCRAFADMDKIVALTSPLRNSFGILLAMKGQKPHEKLPDQYEIIELKVPFIEAERCLICVKP